MIRQICNVKPQDSHHQVQSSEILARLGIEDLGLILKERRLRWYGHVERSNGTVTTAFDLQVDDAWAWETQNDKETADREGLQTVEALGYRPS